MKRIAILGNGVAGITAARHIRKLDSTCSITVVSAESDHFYSRTALMYIYMGHMRYDHTKPYEDWFWEKNGIDLVRGWVSRVDTEGRRLLLDDGKEIGWDVLVLATGSQTNRFGWPGENLDGVEGLYGLQDLEAMERWTRDTRSAVVVGGGLIGVEMAEMLHSRHIETTMLVREGWYWGNILPREEGEMIARHIRAHGIDLRLETELQEILPDASGRVRGTITSRGEEITCQFVGLTAGVGPNVAIAQESGIETGRGVLVNRYFETGIPDIYAVGDCVEFRDPEPGNPRVEQLWYTAKMHGEVVAQTICGTRTPYRRGVWFNSAKFFDIEFQTYGFVPVEFADNHGTLWWEHPDGTRGVRLVWEKSSSRILGVNLFGIRHRHDVWRHWLNSGATLAHVLNRINDADFDPEFTRPIYGALIEAARRETVAG